MALKKEAARGSRLVLAFCSFVTLQTISQLLYRKATRDGSYLVNTAGSMILAEAIKLGISLGLVYKEKTPLRMPTTTALGYVALAVGYAANNQLTFVRASRSESSCLSVERRLCILELLKYRRLRTA